jgi:hypothetical protein
MNTLVAVATGAQREALLPKALGSLRRQCDRLHVFLNGYAEAPACVRELADSYVLSAEDLGADEKFHWAHEHEGVYLSCDDDFLYPPDYVSRMASQVERFGGRALVTAHGRTYPPRPTGAGDQLLGRTAVLTARVPHGRWVNHAGTGVLAWDASRIKVPRQYPVLNRTDVQLSAWANREGIPIWVVPHNPGWLRPLPNTGDSVSKQSRREGHSTKNALLLQHPEWKLHEIQDR